jgi:signal peptidase I
MDQPNNSETMSLPRPPLQRWVFAREVVEMVILIIAIYSLVNMASMRYIIDGPSMEPNFYTGQFIIVSRLNYVWGQPRRGDIVVFHRPDRQNEDLIKRVIGTPGDTVEIRNQQVYVNGIMLNESYINEPCVSCAERTWTLGEDEFFVMGDNRNHSSDSRIFGVVQRNQIVGEALFRYWPWQDIGAINRTNYPDN